MPDEVPYYWKQHDLGFRVQNDYRWTDAVNRLYDEDKTKLDGFHIPTIEEYYNVDLSRIEMTSEFKAGIDRINRLANETNEAAKRGDLVAIRKNYREFQKFQRDLPYDVSEILKNWK